MAVDSNLETIMDDFEHRYTVQWLTNLLQVLPMSDPSQVAFRDGGDERIEGILDRAADLLSSSSGPSASSSVSQTYRIPSRVSTGKDGTALAPSSPLVEIIIKEGSINSCEHGGAVGMQTWESAMVLAKCIAEDPGLFMPLRGSESSTNQFQGGPIRVLELGAGTGLVSIAVAKIASRHIQHRIASSDSPDDPKVEVFATDYDETVLTNLHENLSHNGPYGYGVSVTSRPLDWEYYYRLSTVCDGNEQKDPFPTTTMLEGEDDLFHSFDIILAADVVYEIHQAEWLRAAIQYLLRYPNRGPNPHPTHPIDNPLFYLVVPVRQTHIAELESITRVFTPIGVPAAAQCTRTSKCQLAILRSLQIGEEGNSFMWYEIGWVDGMATTI